MSSEYERKLIDMQYQIRENNAYLQDYMKDLDSWTTEIKKKEENLKTAASSTTSSTTKDLPPVRNFVEPPKPKKKLKKKSSTTKTSTSIRSYDYRSWDKFDVDAECTRIDDVNEEGYAEDEENDEDDEEWQEKVLKQKAEYYKDCGNYHFKQKSYSEAIEFYTKAIECDPTCHVYFANRAQCQLFEQRYGACETDCTLAIQLDANYLKAYYRRALARIQLEKFDQARQDLEHVIAREPSNNEAKIKLAELNRNEEIKRLGRVYPLPNKPIDQRSTKPLKRIEIQEIDTSIIASSQITKKKSIVIEEMDTVHSEPVVSTTSPPSPPPPPTQNPTVSEKQPTKPTTALPSTIPTTGFQFKRDWSNLNNQIEQQSIYFSRIPPKSYKTIFSTGVDSSVFSRILLFWSNQTNVDQHLIDSMYELRQTPRFDTQLSFLGSDDKKLLKIILQKLESECSSIDKVRTILDAYKID